MSALDGKFTPAQLLLRKPSDHLITSRHNFHAHKSFHQRKSSYFLHSIALLNGLTGT